jgi:hypothetical protein
MVVGVHECMSLIIDGGAEKVRAKGDVLGMFSFENCPHTLFDGILMALPSQRDTLL